MVLFIICSFSLFIAGFLFLLVVFRHASIKSKKPRSGVPELPSEVLFLNMVQPWVSNPTHPTTNGDEDGIAGSSDHDKTNPKVSA